MERIKSTGLTILSLICIFLCGKAQQTVNKDSLLQLLRSAKDDSAKVQLYIDIGNRYELDDPKTAGKYYLLAGELSRRLHYKKGTIKFISNYTAILNQRSDYDSSLILNKESIQLAKEINDNLIVGKCYANTGNAFQYLNNYDSSLYYYETAKRYFEQANEKVLVARMSDLMQNTYRELKRYSKASQLGKEAVSVLRSVGDSLYLGIALSNLGTNYSFTDADTALKCFEEAIVIAKRVGYVQLELAGLVNIGNIYLHKYDADKMKSYYERALQLSRQLEEPESESIARRGLAHFFLYKKDFTEAKKYITHALAISDSLHMQKEQFENLKTLSSVLYAMHDAVGAEKSLDSASVIEASLTGDDMQNKTLAIEKRFETAKKEAQIKLQQAQLRQQSIVNYFLIGGTVALLIISLLTYRNYRHRQMLQQARIDELETEKQLTATEAVLKGEEQERTRLAKDLHDGLGGMLSGIKFSLSNMKENLIMTPDNAQAFERSIDMLDSSIKEMRRVAHNMMPEVLVKYGLDTALREFCSEIDRSGVAHISYQPVGMNDLAVKQSTALSIYRIVQELVTNAIKHAAANNVLVQAHLSAQEKQLTITVEDDGKGFDTTALQHATGIGWSNIQNRVAFLKGKTDVRSEPGKGTSVLVEVSV